MSVRLTNLLNPIWAYLGVIIMLWGCGTKEEAGMMAARCVEDRFHRLPAPELSLGTLDGLRGCPGHTDVFRVDENLDGSVELIVAADGIVDVEVIGEGFSPVASEGEALSFRGTLAGQPVEVRVRGDDAAYSIELRRTRAQLVCNDHPPATSDTLPVVVDAGVLCENNTRWFKVRGNPGDQLTVTMTAGPKALDAEILEHSNGAFLRSESVSIAALASGNSTRVLPVSGELYLRIRGEVGDPFELRMVANARGSGHRTLSGHLESWTRTVDREGLSEPIAIPGKFVRLDVLSADGMILSSVLTDQEGRFHTDFVSQAQEEVSLRVNAEAWSGRGMVRVGPGMGDDRPWSETVLTTNAPVMDQVFTLSTDGTLAPALSVALTAVSGLRFLGDELPAWTLQMPDVRYRWRPNGAAECGTCFKPGVRPIIELSGRRDDPDEWDRSVILHELSHYIFTVYGIDDSPGGPHSGMRTRPTVAWSEGVATFLSSVLLGTSVQLDYRAAGVREIDLESYTAPESLGTSDETQEGDLSEYLVATLLWDLLDSPDADDDPLAVSLGTILSPLFGSLIEEGSDRGYPGLDLVDYLDAIACQVDLEPLIDARRFPYDGGDCGP